MKKSIIQGNIKITLFTESLIVKGKGKTYFVIQLRDRDQRLPFYERKFYNLETKEVNTNEEVVSGLNQLAKSVYPNQKLDFSEVIKLVKAFKDN